MAGNTFGNLFRVTSFGESHGAAIGGVIDGCPAGVRVDMLAVQEALNRRRPGQSDLTTPRKEKDRVEILSGLFNGVTTGTPIGFIVRNEDQRSADYSEISKVFRPSHADYTYEAKYGLRDYRGGGRSSARETIARVVAGAFAEQVLSSLNIEVLAFVDQVGSLRYEGIDFPSKEAIEKSLVRCPDKEHSDAMVGLIEEVRDAKDSIGGAIRCMVQGVPAGWGEPVFDKLSARLGYAMLGINAVKGFEIGSGFRAAEYRGSAHNDAFEKKDDEVSTSTNRSGGVQGGISNGMIIDFRVAFKPVATIGLEQKTLSIEGKETTLAAKGRHDPCVVPRAVPIIEAMTWLTLCDFYLLSKSNRI